MFMRDINAAGGQVTARRELFNDMGSAAAPAVVTKDKEDR
jgi:hypothetical protein